MPSRARPDDTVDATSARRASDPSVFPTDDGPSSEIRTIELGLRPRRLVVSTSLRDAAAEASWVTVTDPSGAVYFEGSLDARGSIAVSIDFGPQVERVHVLLETGRAHRQAQVTLGDGVTHHTFD